MSADRGAPLPPRPKPGEVEAAPAPAPKETASKKSAAKERRPSSNAALISKVVEMWEEGYLPVDISQELKISQPLVRKIARQHAPNPVCRRGPILLTKRTIRAVFDIMDGVDLDTVAEKNRLHRIEAARIRRLVMEAT